MTLFCSHCQAYLGGAQVCPACGQPQPEPADATPRWTVDLEAVTTGASVAVGGLLFLLVREGMPARCQALLAIDLSAGEVHWRRRLENLLVNDPILAAEIASDAVPGARAPILYVATRSTDPLGKGKLLALDAATGKQIWCWMPGAQAISAPVLLGGVLYVVIDGDELCAVEAGDGEERWRLQLPMPRSVAAAAISPGMPGRLFLPSRGPHLCAVDVARQAVAWHLTSPDDAGTWFLETPAAAGDRVYAVSSGGAALALDATSGELLWRRVPGRTRKPLSAPAVDGKRLYVGAGDGLHALSLTDGQEAWSFPTDRRIRAGPVVVEGVVYAACRDHHLYALEAVTGQRLWQVRTERRIDASPVLTGDLIVATDRGGQNVAVERVLSPEAYAEQRRWEEAAAAHVRRGKLPAAARIYQEQLGQPLEAAELWKAAGDLDRTAVLYGEAGRYDLAEACYRQLGQIGSVAEMAARQGDHERAAALFEEVGNWARVRDCYQQLGDRRKVAELSEKLQDWQRAAEEWAALEELPLAAEAWRQAGAWAEAACLYESMEAWPQAAEYHEKASNWEQAGAIYQRLNDFTAAASAYVQAARELEQANPDHEIQLIELWTQAERACWRANKEAEGEECRRQLARLQGLPYIEVDIIAPETMVEGKYARVEFVLHNRGGAEARQIVVHHTSSEFVGDLSVSLEIRGLHPEQQLSQYLSIRPLVSGPVPLNIAIDYVDTSGALHEINYRTHIIVLEEEETRAMPPAPRHEPPSMISTFADFDVLFGQRRDRSYPVHVVRSPAGEARGTFDLPFEELDTALWRLEAGTTDRAFLRSLGSRLFTALFRGDVGNRFRSSQGMTAQGKGLRVRLRLDSGDLLALPWELCYDPERDEFLSLTRRVPMVHYLPVPRPTTARPVSLPLRLLVVPASPKNMEPLDVQAEVAGLQQAIEPLVSGGKLAVDILEEPTVRELRKCLLDRSYHILHFIGHGGSDGQRGCIMLEDAAGQAATLDGEGLGMLLYDTPVRLAVLNACLTGREPERRGLESYQRNYLGVAPALVDAGLLAVVGMQFSISDTGSRLFAQDFCEMLARQKPVDEAVDQARVAMALALGLGCRDWAAPVLFMRGSSGEIFPIS